MLLTPYRILEDGSSENLPNNTLQFTYMDIFESNDSEALEATFTIMSALQKFITDKNI
jgi:hypothetical protein